jgi:hypothetical protein
MICQFVATQSLPSNLQPGDMICRIFAAALVLTLSARQLPTSPTGIFSWHSAYGFM